MYFPVLGCKARHQKTKKRRFQRVRKKPIQAVFVALSQIVLCHFRIAYLRFLDVYIFVIFAKKWQQRLFRAVFKIFFCWT